MGHENIRIALASQGNAIYIQPNIYGQRFTPNYFGYSQKPNENNFLETQWVSSYDAKIPLESNFLNTQTNLMNETQSTNSNSIYVKNPFSYLIHPKDFPISGLHPILGSSLHILLNIPQFSGNQDSLIITVPSASTPLYRYALKESIDLFNSKNSFILDQNTAIAVYFALDQLNFTSKKQYDILFIDIGASHSEISYWRFKSVHSKLISLNLIDFHSSDEISGDELDDAFLQYLLDQIKSKKPNFVENTQTLLYLKKYAKKIKEEYSEQVSNHTIEVSFNFSGIQELSDIEPFNLTFSDSEIEKISQKVITKFKDLIKSSSSRTPDQIELIGGASKFPIFSNILKQQFNEVELNRCPASDEAVALGAAYFAAIETKLFYGTKLNITKPSLYSYSVKKGNRKLPLLEGGKPFRKSLVSSMTSDDFSITFSCHLPNSSIPKINSKEFNKTINDLDILTVGVYGFDEIKSQYQNKLERSSFLINFTFDYRKTLDCMTPVNIFAINYVNNVEKKWKIEPDISFCDSSLDLPQESEDIVAEVIKSKTQKKKQSKFNITKEELINTLNIAEERLKYDYQLSLVTTLQERLSLLNFISSSRQNFTKILSKYLNISDETNQTILSKRKRTTIKKMSSLLTTLKLRMRSVLLKADERYERPLALEMVERAIKQAENEIPKATTDIDTIKKFADSVNSLISAKANAEKINDNPYETPIILAKDLIRRANSILARIPELYGPKRSTTHFNQPDDNL